MLFLRTRTRLHGRGWLQGVELHGRTLPALIDLQPPQYSEIHLLIRTRMKRLLAGFPKKGELPELFPFPQEFMDKLAGELTLGHSNTLRAILTQLQQEYRRVVQPPTHPCPDPYAAWQNLVANAGRKLASSYGDHRQSLHQGLGLLLQKAAPWSRGYWQIKNVRAVEEVGSSRTYGTITVVDWGLVNPTSALSNGQHLRVAIGMLLASGAGILHNLRALLEAFAKRPLKIQKLIILWPNPSAVKPDPAQRAAALPKATQNLWTNNRHSADCELRFVSHDCLKMIFAFPDWDLAVQGNVLNPMTDSAIRLFVHKHCGSVLDLVVPVAIAQGNSVP